MTGVLPNSAGGSESGEPTGRAEETHIADVIQEIDECLLSFADKQTVNPAEGFWSKHVEEEDGPSVGEVANIYAPVGLTEQFEQMYRLLHHGLVRNDNNASAFLVGPTGSGKSLCLDQCLAAFRDELDAIKRPHFRVIRLHGTLIPVTGGLAAVVREVLRQVAASASTSQLFSEEEEKDSATPRSQPPQKKPKREMDARLEELLRLKASSNANQVLLLRETVEIAALDGIPFVFVLDDLDVLLGNDTQSGGADTHERSTKARQMFLYQILDLVASSDACVSFVGIASNQGFKSRLEKRIRSRAEGTSTFVRFGGISNYGCLKRLLLGKLCGSLHNTVASALEHNSKKSTSDDASLRRLIKRQLCISADPRWFCCVFVVALGLYRRDCCSFRAADVSEEPRFSSKYLLEALRDMGVSTETGVSSNMAMHDPHHKALLDLRGPEVVMVLAAKRVLARDSLTDRMKAPLTMERIIGEFTSSYKGIGSEHTPAELERAFWSLLSTGIFKSAVSSQLCRPLLAEENGETSVVSSKVPIHVSFDTREIAKLLEDDRFSCSTSLRVWGRRNNS